jgi:hypothetical protein
MNSRMLCGSALIWRSSSDMARSPGMGKSESAVALFNRLKDQGAKNGETWGMGVVFAATQTPPDLIGYQFKACRGYTAVAAPRACQQGSPWR